MKKKILIFGKGKIGKAFFYLAKKEGFEVQFFKRNLDFKKFDIFLELCREK